MKRPSILQLLIIYQGYPSLGFHLNATFPAATKAPFPTRPSNHIEQRAISTELSTCGYLDGDPSKERTADSGYNCRVDTKNGLWGFCPTTVLTASDCGLAGSCIDNHACSDGCGMTDSKDLTTFTCRRKSFCSVALLTFGVDQTYSYIACGTKAATDHYQITPTSGETTTSESIEPTASQIKTKTSSAVSSQTLSSTTETAQSTSAEASSTSSEEDTPANPSTNIGAIVGGVIGGLVVICGTVIVAILLPRRNRRRDAGDDTPGLEVIKDSSPPIWAQSNTKDPQELGGRSIHEMPIYVTSDRHSPIELAA
ncbi:hypothetical protein FGRMN_1452 [Fusarium graminum]|nr:hypothetical protein FGRMN_1452 [Fusarium graminum]